MITKKQSYSVGVDTLKPTYFADLDLDFNVNPATNDLVILRNDLAIRRSVRNLVMLNFGEKPFNPTVGSNVRKILFEPMTPDVAGRLKTYITQTLDAHEPRIQLQEVEVTATYSVDGYNVNIRFFLMNSVSELQNINVFLQRVR